MMRRREVRFSRRPQVGLMIETSQAPGRAILAGITQYMHEHESWAISLEPGSMNELAGSWLTNWRGDGIIVRLYDERVLGAVARLRVPAVDVLGAQPHPDIPLVRVDNVAIARLAAEHLMERGLRHFAFYGLQGAGWSMARRDAFRSVVAAGDAGCDVYEGAFPDSADWSWEKERSALRAWISGLPKPVGIMVCHDPCGAIVLETCRELGVAVPEEAAVVGVNNDEVLCELCDPPLSSVAANHEKAGYEAAKLLDRLMQGDPPPAEALLTQPHEVVGRRSTEIQAIADSDVAAALRFIREYACKGISVTDVAKDRCVHSRTLLRRFQAVLGRSVHDEILRVRLRTAQDLLRRTSIPIGQIAHKVGFHHQEYLTALFKAKLGETPRDYRARHSKKGRGPVRRKR
jgi:LacI family transcriptional regulator